MLSGKSLNWVAVIIWGAVIYADSRISPICGRILLMDYVLRKIVHSLSIWSAVRPVLQSIQGQL